MLNLTQFFYLSLYLRRFFFISKNNIILIVFKEKLLFTLRMILILDNIVEAVMVMGNYLSNEMSRCC